MFERMVGLTRGWRWVRTRIGHRRGCGLPVQSAPELAAPSSGMVASPWMAAEPDVAATAAGLAALASGRL
jgi:hypothetical protein